MRDPRKLAVIIPCYNKVYWTQKTINSLIDCTRGDLYIILVNDASSDDTVSYMLELNDVLNVGKETNHLYYIQNAQNLGVNTSWNKGLKTAMALEIEHICIANNDLLFTDGWDILLMDALDNDGYALCSPMSTEQKLPEDFPRGKSRHVNPVGGMGILGACFMFRRNLINLIGYFPEIPKIYYGDNWILDSVKCRDLKYGHIQDSYIHHFFCQTTSGLNNGEIFQRETNEYKNYNQQKKFTIGHRARQPKVYEEFLKKSLNNLSGNFNLIKIDAGDTVDCSDFASTKYPAQCYNEMLEACTTPYLILPHEDVSFTGDLLEMLEATIAEYPDFGVIGLVGAAQDGNKWSESGVIHEVDTLDSCFIVVRKDFELKFDEQKFGEFHLFAEDYCARTKQLGKKIYTIKFKEGSGVGHHSATWTLLGPCWGNYTQYWTVFRQKYPHLKTT